jgi:hypothetical protein
MTDIRVEGGACADCLKYHSADVECRPTMTDETIRDAIGRVADRLIDQRDEPWPSGTESDRLHYWRDKAIKAAADLRTLLAALDAPVGDERK